ncbi:tyrosine-type recombinase/integrase [Alicyclobacillus mengziensis]|uniref:Tyrosine-type recombinase/integrase n=1 Tax=Alicyclobacillus mengziensis TaxID=2931921 RepID=A0A9X7Z833_9BACL|nr:tyrosine-type recombinase/integrase [Alicyclobacillus mengziensis]QSO49172.1 tyrosine-type recombinase/integrase [Alicyclobacillus mengziensis]
MQQDKRIGRKTVRSRNGQAKRNTARYTIDQAFELFYHAKSGEGLRKRTLVDYKNHHRYLVSWLTEIHPQVEYIEDVSPQLLREYIYYLSHEKPQYEGHPYKSDNDKSKLGLSPGCVNVRVTTMKSFFAWLHREAIIPSNPTVNIKKQAVEEDTIEAFTDDQIELLLQQPNKHTYAGFRDYILMRLLLESGMRINEVLSLTTENIDFKTRLITLSGAQNKNRKVRIIPLSPDMVRLVMDLMAENKTYFPEAMHLFLANYGEPLSQEGITHRVKQYGREAGIAEHVRCSPHTFRHTFAKSFLTAGGDIIALQRILGHSSMDMVRKYVQHTPEDLRNAHDKFTVRLKSSRRLM